MRGFQCHFGILENNKIVNNTNESNLLKCNIGSACWAGLKRIPENTMYIYIEKYIKNDFLKRLIQLINNITPCKYIIINNKEYIKYKLIDYEKNKGNKKFNFYMKNLLVLNFLRMNWYKNYNLNHEGFVKSIMKPSRGVDSLQFILSCIKENIINKHSNRNWGNHSAVYKNIKIKKTKDLLKSNKRLISSFLTEKL